MKLPGYLNILLWLMQIIVSGSMLWSGYVKLFLSQHALATMWPWVADVSPYLVKFTGIVDVVGAIGLVLPGFIPTKSRWISHAAFGVIALMISAAIFHLIRGELTQIIVNVVFGIIVAIIAWGRWSTGK